MRLVVLLLVIPCFGYDDWPQFRGPHASGVASKPVSVLRIGPDEPFLWKIDTPPGHSSPIVARNHIFLTAVEGGERKQLAPGRVTDPGGKLVTLCVDRLTGKIVWRNEVPRPRLEIYQPTNSPASPSPVTDGKIVIVFFGDFGLIAYDVDSGAEKWRLPLGPFNNPNGHGSSPVLVKDLVVLLCDQDNDSYLIAVDKVTGKVRWKVARPESTRSYSTPAVYKDSELVVPGAFSLAGYAASTGEKLWWVSGLSWQPKSSPVIDGDMIYAHWWEAGGENDAAAVTMTFAEALEKYDANHDGKIAAEEFDDRLRRGFGDLDLDHDGFVNAREWDFYAARRASKNALLAIKHGERGDLTQSKSIVWRMMKFLPNVPSPLVHQGILYLIKDGGILSAVDGSTGSVFKQGRLSNGQDTYYASPVAAGDRLYFMSQSGKFSIVQAGAAWEYLSGADFAEESFATPAIVDGVMYLRTRTKLYAFGKAK